MIGNDGKLEEMVSWVRSVRAFKRRATKSVNQGLINIINARVNKKMIWMNDWNLWIKCDLIELSWNKFLGNYPSKIIKILHIKKINKYGRDNDSGYISVTKLRKIILS